VLTNDLLRSSDALDKIRVPSRIADSRSFRVALEGLSRDLRNPILIRTCTATEIQRIRVHRTRLTNLAA